MRVQVHAEVCVCVCLHIYYISYLRQELVSATADKKETQEAYDLSTLPHSTAPLSDHRDVGDVGVLRNSTCNMRNSSELHCFSRVPLAGQGW